MDGTTFLALYGVLFLLALATAWKVRRHLRVPDDDVRDGELHPYLHAYLLGGEARALACPGRRGKCASFPRRSSAQPQ